ncbi:MAG: tetratricopeptide repeat protein [Candidatus Polarisedimenticolaceae bacterium]|nr:tetratricopeptide repeat protein [Candidatus Polarisedimenticolaceae bacterium]
MANTHQAMGEWEQARTLFSESLDIRRQIIVRVGETPESLRDLSVSLNNVANTHKAMGEWEQARTTFEEGLHLGLQLAKHLPNHPDYATLADHFTRQLQALEKKNPTQ